MHRFEPDTYKSRPLDRDETVPHGTYACGRCYDFGLWLTPQGIVSECPKLQLGHNDHRPLNEAAKMVYRAGRGLADRGIRIESETAFRVARQLARFSCVAPCPGQAIIDRCFQWAGSQKLRHMHSCIEELRAVWHLPVGSRKGQPSGYWICVDADDFRDYFTAAKSAPIKALSTLHAVARANFPIFARQLELEFGEELISEPEYKEAA